TRKLEFSFEKYKIQYIPGKKLTIRKGHHSAVFFDIAQYYQSSLVNAYQSNIAQLDESYLLMKSKRESFSKEYYRINRKQVREYCIKDCKLTKQLAEHWISLFRESFGFYPQRWISSGYLAEKVLINHRIYIPKFTEIPYKVQDIAWRSYYGGRFEILKRGFIGEAHLYDINSAYPYALSTIPDLTKGKWIKRKSIHPDSKLGFFKIECDIPDCKYVAPFPFRMNNKIIFPSGKFQTYCTLKELQACKEKLYRILEGYQFIPTSDIYPYRKFINNLYKKRMELKEQNNPLQLPLKVILNSIYGKTAQRVGNKIGNLFCPVIASTITGHTRAMLYEFVSRHGISNNLVSFATDSVISRKKINVDSERLGDFKLEKSAKDVYVLQNGIYRFNDSWKKRGIGKLGSRTIEHLDTVEKDGNLYQVMKVLRTNRLRSSILSGKIKDVGKFHTIERRVNLNADDKRMWFEKINNVNDLKLIDSLPISMNFHSKIESNFLETSRILSE
ncbi:MAG: DNA polymerase, partial [Thaumarchaeota archaeon]|nr:DNA polymerase [Nitrososphaerota archaeon]